MHNDKVFELIKYDLQHEGIYVLKDITGSTINESKKDKKVIISLLELTDRNKYYYDILCDIINWGIKLSNNSNSVNQKRWEDKIKQAETKFKMICMNWLKKNTVHGKYLIEPILQHCNEKTDKDNLYIQCYNNKYALSLRAYDINGIRELISSENSKNSVDFVSGMFDGVKIGKNGNQLTKAATSFYLATLASLEAGFPSLRIMKYKDNPTGQRPITKAFNSQLYIPREFNDNKFPNENYTNDQSEVDFPDFRDLRTTIEISDEHYSSELQDFYKHLNIAIASPFSVDVLSDIRGMMQKLVNLTFQTFYAIRSAKGNLAVPSFEDLRKNIEQVKDVESKNEVKIQLINRIFELYCKNMVPLTFLILIEGLFEYKETWENILNLFSKTGTQILQDFANKCLSNLNGIVNIKPGSENKDANVNDLFGTLDSFYMKPECSKNIELYYILIRGLFPFELTYPQYGTMATTVFRWLTDPIKQKDIKSVKALLDGMRNSNKINSSSFFVAAEKRSREVEIGEEEEEEDETKKQKFSNKDEINEITNFELIVEEMKYDIELFKNKNFINHDILDKVEKYLKNQINQDIFKFDIRYLNSLATVLKSKKDWIQKFNTISNFSSTSGSVNNDILFHNFKLMQFIFMTDFNENQKFYVNPLSPFVDLSDQNNTVKSNNQDCYLTRIKIGDDYEYLIYRNLYTKFYNQIYFLNLDNFKTNKNKLSESNMKLFKFDFALGLKSGLLALLYTNIFQGASYLNYEKMVFEYPDITKFGNHHLDMNCISQQGKTIKLTSSKIDKLEISMPLINTINPLNWNIESKESKQNIDSFDIITHVNNLRDIFLYAIRIKNEKGTREWLVGDVYTREVDLEKKEYIRSPVKIKGSEGNEYFKFNQTNTEFCIWGKSDQTIQRFSIKKNIDIGFNPQQDFKPTYDFIGNITELNNSHFIYKKNTKVPILVSNYSKKYESKVNISNESLCVNQGRDLIKSTDGQLFVPEDIFGMIFIDLINSNEINNNFMINETPIQFLIIPKNNGILYLR
jgi:hypothetical protein